MHIPLKSLLTFWSGGPCGTRLLKAGYYPPCTPGAIGYGLAFSVSAISAHGIQRTIQNVLSNRLVSDIPETVVLGLLQIVVSTSASKGHKDAMKVVDAAPIPTLPQFLGACIDYPLSTPLLRAAIKEHFKRSEDLAALLGLLVHWVVLNCGRADELDVDLTPIKLVSKKPRRKHAAAQFQNVRLWPNHKSGAN